MKVTQEDVADRQAVLHIKLEEQDLSGYLERGYRKVVQRTNIPGFRQGKAPLHIVERFMGRESLLSEVLDFMLPDATTRAVDDQKLETSGFPKFDNLELDPVSFTATVALTPEVDLGGYRDIRVEPQPVEVTEEDIKGRLEELRTQAAVWNPVERKVKLGDLVTMDLTATIDGRPVMEEKDAVYMLEKSSQRPVPGFVDNLVGLKEGKPKEFTVAVPADFTDARTAGTEMAFSVTLGNIKERTLPELDDEFAKGVGDGFESLDTLRVEVEKGFRVNAEEAEEARFKEAAVDALLEGATVQLAPMLVEHQVEHMLADQQTVLERMGVRMDDYLKMAGKTEEEFQEEIRKDSITRLNRRYALFKLSEAEGLDVPDEEVQERLKAILSNSGSQRDNRRRRDADEAKQSVHDSLLVSKSLDRLAAIARGDGTNPGQDASDENEDEQPNKQPNKGDDQDG